MKREHTTRLFVGLFALFCAVTLLLPWSLERVVAFTAIDDALYYIKVAHNFVHRGMCTYDGVTLTNGFHPLWAVLLVPLCAVFSDPFTTLAATYVYVFLFLLAAALLFGRILRKLDISSAGIAVAYLVLLLNLRSFTIFFGLLESHVILLGYLLYLRYALARTDDRFTATKTAFVAGLLMGVCFLARIDSFLLPASYGLVLTWRLLVRRSIAFSTYLRSGLAAACGLLLLALPFLALNYATFGHVQTVSAYSKAGTFSLVEGLRTTSSWLYEQLIPRLQYVTHLERIPAPFFMAILAAIALGALAFVLTGPRRARLKATLSRFPEFAIFAPLHWIFCSAVARSEMMASAWYWVPEILLAALVLGCCVRDVVWRRIPVVPVVAALLVLAQALMVPGFVRKKTMTFAKLEAAKFLREQTPPGSRGVMFDSGIMSYFGDRDFVGLNGLIGDFEMLKTIKARQLDELAEKYKIDLLVMDVPRDQVLKLSTNVLYQTKLETRFSNFQEAPKPFVIYRLGPGELKRIWTERFGP